MKIREVLIKIWEIYFPDQVDILIKYLEENPFKSDDIEFKKETETTVLEAFKYGKDAIKSLIEDSDYFLTDILTFLASQEKICHVFVVPKAQKVKNLPQDTIMLRESEDKNNVVNAYFVNASGEYQLQEFTLKDLIRFNFPKEVKSVQEIPADGNTQPLFDAVSSACGYKNFYLFTTLTHYFFSSFSDKFNFNIYQFTAEMKAGYGYTQNILGGYNHYRTKQGNAPEHDRGWKLHVSIDDQNFALSKLDAIEIEYLQKIQFPNALSALDVSDLDYIKQLKLEKKNEKFEKIQQKLIKNENYQSISLKSDEVSVLKDVLASLTDERAKQVNEKLPEDLKLKEEFKEIQQKIITKNDYQFLSLQAAQVQVLKAILKLLKEDKAESIHARLLIDDKSNNLRKAWPIILEFAFKYQLVRFKIKNLSKKNFDDSSLSADSVGKQITIYVGIDDNVSDDRVSNLFNFARELTIKFIENEIKPSEYGENVRYVTPYIGYKNDHDPNIGGLYRRPNLPGYMRDEQQDPFKETFDTLSELFDFVPVCNETKEEEEEKKNTKKIHHTPVQKSFSSQSGLSSPKQTLSTSTSKTAAKPSVKRSQPLSRGTKISSSSHKVPPIFKLPTINLESTSSFLKKDTSNASIAALQKSEHEQNAISEKKSRKKIDEKEVNKGEYSQGVFSTKSAYTAPNPSSSATSASSTTTTGQAPMITSANTNTSTTQESNKPDTPHSTTISSQPLLNEKSETPESDEDTSPPAPAPS